MESARARARLDRLLRWISAAVTLHRTYFGDFLCTIPRQFTASSHTASWVLSLPIAVPSRFTLFYSLPSAVCSGLCPFLLRACMIPQEYRSLATICYLYTRLQVFSFPRPQTSLWHHLMYCRPVYVCTCAATIVLQFKIQRMVTLEENLAMGHGVLQVQGMNVHLRGHRGWRAELG